MYESAALSVVGLTPGKRAEAKSAVVLGFPAGLHVNKSKFSPIQAEYLDY